MSGPNQARRPGPTRPLPLWRSPCSLRTPLFTRLRRFLHRPYIATPRDDEPYIRTIAQLRRYCGYGDPIDKRRKGMSRQEALLLGNLRIKTRLHLIAEQFLKQRTPVYRDLYDEARQRYEVRDDWTPKHRDYAARRFAIKQFIKDMWIVSRDLHEAQA